jgi:hypothetical protein
VGAFFVDRADFSADPVRDGEFRNEALDFVCQRLSIMSAHKSDFTECLDEHFRNPSRPFRGNRVCGKMGREKFRTQKLRIRDQSAMELFAKRTVSSTFSAGNFAHLRGFDRFPRKRAINGRPVARRAKRINC